MEILGPQVKWLQAQKSSFINNEKTSIKKFKLNKLKETKNFSVKCKNDLIECNLSKLHFDDAFKNNESNELNFCQMKVLKIINISHELTKIHIIPPETDDFNIYYEMPKYFVPGHAIEVKVIFSTTIPGYYQDAIYIHTEQSDANLIIPLLAYPTIPNFKIPRYIPIPPIQIGESHVAVVPLKSTAVVSFEFEVTIIQMDQSFEIAPLKGIIPANGMVKLRITYRPINFISSLMEFSVNISQMHFIPLKCRVFGTSKPGIARDRLVASLGETLMNSEMSERSKLRSLKKGNQNAFFEFHKRHHAIEPHNQKMCFLRLTHQDTIEEAKNRVLWTKKLEFVGFQEAEKAAILKERLISIVEKKRRFLQLMHQDTIEEERNRVRWTTKLGFFGLHESEETAILKERLMYNVEMDYSIWRPTITIDFQQRNLEPISASLFNLSNLQAGAFQCDWRHRQEALQRFQSAVATVVNQARAKRLLRRLAKIAVEINAPTNLLESRAKNRAAVSKLTVDVSGDELNEVKFCPSASGPLESIATNCNASSIENNISDKHVQDAVVETKMGESKIEKTSQVDEMPQNSDTESEEEEINYETGLESTLSATRELDEKRASSLDNEFPRESILSSDDRFPIPGDPMSLPRWMKDRQCCQPFTKLLATTQMLPANVYSTRREAFVEMKCIFPQPKNQAGSNTNINSSGLCPLVLSKLVENIRNGMSSSFSHPIPTSGMNFPDSFTDPAFIDSIVSSLVENNAVFEAENDRIWNDLRPYLKAYPAVFSLLSPKTKSYLKELIPASCE